MVAGADNYLFVADWNTADFRGRFGDCAIHLYVILAKRM